MNYLDLFSGIGGFHKGLEEAGFKFDWSGHSEIDKYAKSIYQKHFPQSEDLGDVSNINVSELPEVDLVTFGFPCQDLSIAGKRGGLGASRSGLFHEAIRIIEAKKPSYFIFENVKGLFSSNGGKDFLSVLGAIADIGYNGQWQLLNTRWFLPQNRERIYFVGYPRERSGQQIFPIGEGGGEIDGLDGLIPVGDTGSNSQGYRVYDPAGVSVTLAGQGGGVGAKTGLYEIQSGIRRLTPTECERLQGFPDDWTKYGKDGEEISDTQRYKTLGNAVSVPVVKAVGERII